MGDRLTYLVTPREPCCYKSYIKQCHLLSSFVLANRTELLTPSPAELKANTQNSYLVNLANAVTFFAYIVTLETEMFSSLLILEPSFLKNILNPIMIPCLESGAGSCQDAMIAVDVLAVTVKFLGAFDGAERF